MTPGSSSQPEPQLDEPRRRRDRSTGATIIDLSTRNALPPVSSRPRSERLGMFAGLAVVALLVGLTVWTIRQSQEKPGLPSAQRPEQAANLPGTALPASQPGDWELKIEPPGPLNAASANETPAAALPAPDLSPVLANPLALPDISEGLPPPSTRPSAGPTVVFGSGPEDSGVGFAFEPGAGNEFGGAVKSQRASPTGNGGSKLLAPPGDPARTLGKGTLIPAILETAIDSNVPGGVRAVVSADVLTPDGKRSLVPRSSRLVGQYKTRRSAGQNSAYVVWTQIVRPDGVRLDIPSKAAGSSERQFFERFGSERLISVVAGQTGSDLRARQGEPVRIMAARDVDLTPAR